MNIAVIAIVTILITIVMGLIAYNVNLHGKIKDYKNTHQKIKNLSVVQDFMTAIGESSSVEDKIKKINDILIEKYEIKYSSIVVFDGAEYKIRASNVDPKHWDSLRKLHEIDMFKDSIESATPKYVTVNSDTEKLPYQKMEFGRAKSAIFFPLYFDNVYIGYWIIESGVMHDFDNVDTTVLEVIKENIVSVIKTVMYQKTLESIVRKDEFSELYSEEYLYGEGKKVIDQYTVSTICMFKIINLQQINKQHYRELGDKVIKVISKYISNSISKEYVFVRYMGPKFVIAFSGADVNGVAGFLNEIKAKIETMRIGLSDEEKELYDVPSNIDPKTGVNYDIVTPRLNFVISSYYKGTGLEEVLKKEEEYLDRASIEESNITNI